MAVRGGSKRRTSLLMAAVVAGVLAVTAIAWACTPNMNGSIWFTARPVAQGGTVITSARAGTTVYSQANNLLSRNTDYTIRYGSLGCHGAAGLVLGPRLFRSDANGNWRDQSVALPSLRGTYDMCAVPVVSGFVSNHMSFTII